MASFEVVWKRSAEKELRSLPREVIARMVAIAEGLANEPHPPGARRLTGAERTYRVRSGNYRIVYTIEQHRLVVEVVSVGHRKDVYG